MVWICHGYAATGKRVLKVYRFAATDNGQCKQGNFPTKGSQMS